MSTNDKCRVAMFWATLGAGGVERNGLRIARALLDRGYAVDIVVSQSKGELLDEVPGDARLVDLGVKGTRRRLLRAAFPLSDYLRTVCPDIFWSNGGNASIVSTVARLLASYKGWHIVSIHGLMSEGSRKVTPVQRIFYSGIVGKLYSFADRIHAVSNGVASDLVELTGIRKSRVRVIPNPVVTRDILVKAEEVLDHPWFGSGQPPVVLSVGRLADPKDFRTLIRAFKKVRCHISARLMILGEGPQRSSLETLVAELGLENDVLLPGFVANPFKFMRHASLLVLSTLHEGFGNVLVEAMAVGTPVVATNCPGGPSEILENGKWGDLVTPGDESEMAEAILRSLRKRDNERILGAQARAREFAVERIVDQYIEGLFPGRGLAP